MTRFVAFVSGKGGVGKTTATVNIGQALLGLGHQVLLIDANLATPNIALQLGLIKPEGTINHFLRKEKSLKEVTYQHSSGLSLIPASPSYTQFQKSDLQRISEIFEHLEDLTEFVLVDAPSGLGYEVNQVLKNSDEVFIIATPTLSSVIEALKTIEIAKSYNNAVAGVILNMTHGGRNELTSEEVEKILGHPVIANVPYHRKVRKALHHEVPVNHLYPRSRVAKQFKIAAQHLCQER